MRTSQVKGKEDEERAVIFTRYMIIKREWDRVSSRQKIEKLVKPE